MHEKMRQHFSQEARKRPLRKLWSWWEHENGS